MARPRAPQREPPREPEGDQPGASHGWAGPSRSQMKRDARAVGDIAEALSRLGAKTLERLGLDEELREAVTACREMQRAARDRQVRLVAKLLRVRDHATIAQAVADVDRQSGAQLVREAQAEAWRKRLLAGGDPELGALFAEHPGADRPLLRQLVRQARTDPPDDRSRRAFRELLQRIRALLTEPAPSDD